MRRKKTVNIPIPLLSNLQNINIERLFSLIGILSNQSFVKKIFIEVLENDFPNWVLVLFGVCELSWATFSLLSYHGMDWSGWCWSRLTASTKSLFSV